MKKFARIQDGRVVELTTCVGDITEMFHPGLTWVDISIQNDGVAEGWNYDGALFSPPTYPTALVPSMAMGDIQAQIALLSAQLEAIGRCCGKNEDPITA
ncbi:MAG TPA: hypothetical protein VMB34_03525 [Acetobacteraceae bacterium]|nr:hypothetical protein [Acetobacteraceae bacterium]